MNSLLLEDDVFNYIVRQVPTTGLSPSAILRLELGLLQPSARSQPARSNAARERASGLFEFISSPKLRAQRTVIKRFVLILSFLYGEKPNDFERATENVTGRTRQYFGRTKRELIQSGNHVNPKRIPDTPFWVIGNNSTNMKKDILKAVLQAMGFDGPSISGAQDAL